MKRLVDINKREDISPEYRDTPIGSLLEYHNLNRPFDTYTNAQLLVGMCMDNRNQLNHPNNFAFIIRAGGANLKYSKFKVSFAIAIGGVRYIALIGHTNCGMVNLNSRKEEFINGLVDTVGWDKQNAEDHFMKFAPRFEIGNEIDFILKEVKRLRQEYKGIVVAPMLYKVEDHRLYLIDENHS